MFIRTLISAAVVAASVTCASAADISGAGATFPFPIYAKWADAYKKETGNGLNYQSIGSGAGIKQIKAKTVTFGATDAPLKPKDLDAAGLVQWPMVMGGIVPVVNLDGVKAGDLVLDGPTLAKIYLGKITKWNDPAIEKLNPNVEAARPRHRRRPPRRRLGHDLQLHQLSRQGLAGLGGQDRRGDLGRMADRHRRQGQRRRRQQRRRHQGRDRLCRIRLRQAEQADLRRHDQRGRQDGRADDRSLPGRRRQRRLGEGPRLLPDSVRTSRATSPGR